MQTALLHYTAPPVVGGVEAVLEAHAGLFQTNGYPVTLIAGRGDPAAFPPGAGWRQIPTMDTQHPQVLALTESLDAGQVPPGFAELSQSLEAQLADALRPFDNVIVHNIFSKHFNLPLTAALARLAADGRARNVIAWCHDFTWSSPHSRSRVHPGQPWDLLRTCLPNVTYVVVSEQRRRELVEISGMPAAEIAVIYNGVDPAAVLGLSPAGAALAERLGLQAADLVLVMPVRVTRAKNIEFALETVYHLAQDSPDVRLVITGPPDPHIPDSLAYYETLRRRRSELGLTRQVRFVYESGPEGSSSFEIPITQVYELLRCADVMLMPSLREGYGMPILEAGLAGIPVVAQLAVPAAREIAGVDLGIVLENQTPAETAQEISQLVEISPTLRFKRRVRRSYTWDTLFYQSIEPLLVKSFRK